MYGGEGPGAAISRVHLNPGLVDDGQDGQLEVVHEWGGQHASGVGVCGDRGGAGVEEVVAEGGEGTGGGCDEVRGVLGEEGAEVPWVADDIGHVADGSGGAGVKVGAGGDCWGGGGDIEEGGKDGDITARKVDVVGAGDVDGGSEFNTGEGGAVDDEHAVVGVGNGGVTRSVGAGGTIQLRGGELEAAGAFGNEVEASTGGFAGSGVAFVEVGDNVVGEGEAAIVVALDGPSGEDLDVVRGRRGGGEDSRGGVGGGEREGTL